MPGITENNTCKKPQAFFNPKGKGQAKRTDGIPPSAVKINVTSMKDPYIMRAYIVNDYEETVPKITKKLWEFAKSEEFFNRNNDVDLKIGDMVIVHCENWKNIVELPSFICRGLITNIRKETRDYYIFLVDYGTCVTLIRENLSLCSHDFLSEKYQAKYVSVYNILPLRQKSNSSNATIVEDWSEEAVQYVKDLFKASEITYFDHIITDEKAGVEYGEFYLVNSNMTVRLRDILEIKHYAISSEKVQGKKLVTSFNREQNQESETEHMIHVKISSRRNNITSCNALKNSTTRIFYNDMILIQSKVFCGVFTDVSHLGYPHEVHKSWKEIFKSTRPMKLQTHIWPAINKRLNVVGIGPPRCGKTSGCAMAACGLATLHRHKSYRATQPLILFLCSSSSDVITVQSICSSLLSHINDVRSVAAFSGRTHRSIAATIYGGCQILVTTPRYLVHFLNENKGLLSFDKLFCLILDNADIILQKYYNSVAELFKKHNIIKNRELHGDNAPLLQIIVSASRWTPEIDEFVPVALYKPYICITSLVEAVAFKRRYVCPQLCKVESSCKPRLVSDLLKTDYKSMKTMIVCTNAEEAKELNASLQKDDIKDTMLIHEQMKFGEIQALREDWVACVCDFYPVLICTDAVLSKLKLSDIRWLIHYSLPLQTKTPFSYRFSVLLDILSQDCIDKKKCTVTIIIDEHIRKPLPSIIRMMQQMKMKIPPKLIKDNEQIQLNLEREKKNYALCDRMKSFGFCEEFSSHNTCDFRHCVLPEIDVPLMQKDDVLTFRIIHIHDATHFSARLLTHDPHLRTTEKITFSNVEYFQALMKIQNYFMNVENRKMSTSTNIGDICVLEKPIDKFNRVQIKNIRQNRDISNNVKFVDVRYIDNGILHEYVDARQLLHIPDELMNLPSHVVEIYLADVKPLDEEYKWNHEANEFVRKWFKDNYGDRSYVTGKVCLSLGNTLWLDDLRIAVKVLGHSDLPLTSLKKKLINENFAVPNKEHIPNLTKLCKINGF